MPSLPPIFVELKANATEFMATMDEATSKVETMQKKGASNIDQLATVGKAAFFGLGAAAVGLGGVSLEMADSFEKSHAKLQQAITNTGHSFSEYSSQIGVADKSMEQYGYTNAQTQEALGTLTTALHDPEKALQDLQMAADLAATKHVDLATASLAVAKAAEGQTKPLKQLGIDVATTSSSAAGLAKAQQQLANDTEKATTFLNAHGDAVNANSKYHLVYQQMLDKVHAAQQKVNDMAHAGTDIMKQLGDAIHGQAAAQADTFAGKLAAVKAQGEDVAKNIGMALIPIIMDLVTVVKDITDWFGKHIIVAEALGGVIVSVLVVAIGAYIYTLGVSAVKSATAFVEDIAKGATWVVSKVAQYASVGVAAVSSSATVIAGWVAANAATLGAGAAIGAAIAAIVVVALYLKDHWRQVFDDVKQVIDDAWNWIKAHIDLISALFGPLGILIDVVAKHWSTIWNDVKDVMKDAWDFIDTAVHGIGTVFSKVFGGIGDVVKSAINGVIGIVDGVISGINRLLNIDLGPIHIHAGSIPTIPMLAEGGIVNSPTLAMIGEAGPEAVVPLSKYNSAHGGSGVGGGTTNIYLNVQGSVTSTNDLVQAVRDGLAQSIRRRGGNPSLLGV